MTRQQPAGAEVAADHKESAPNDMAGADAGALASALLLGSNIVDEEGASPKDNLLADIAAPEEAITADVVAADAPKEKALARADKASSSSSSAPLYPEMELVSPLLEEEEDEPN